MTLLVLLACGLGSPGGGEGTGPGIDEDEDGYAPPEDCDDANPDAHPGALEIDNDVDENCDGSLVEDVASLSSSSSVISGEDADLYFGASVLWTSDVTGDGGADLLVGADDATEFQEADGRVFVFASPLSGSVDAETGAHAVITSDQDGDGSGQALGSPGDVDDDGVGDVAFTSPMSYDKGGDEGYTGRVFLFLGPVSGRLRTSDADAMYYATEPLVAFGRDVTSLPATSGNPQWAIGASSTGQIGVFDGVDPSETVSATEAAVSTIVGESASWDGTGDILDSLDFDGDGLTDLLAGAYENSTAGEESGAVYVALGPFSGERALGDDLVWRGENEGDRAGLAFAGLGDVDEDGYDDFVAGALGYSDVADRPGRAYVVRGAADAAAGERSLADASLRIDAEASHAFGAAVSRAGDVDGDGTIDLAVQALGLFSTGVPLKAYVFFGPLGEGTVSSADADRIVTPAGDLDGDLWSLAGGFDQDGDGFADLAIGRPYDDMAYVVPGSP